MRPVLFSVFGFDIQSYGVSKALAALVAAFLLARAFEKLGLKRDSAYSLVMWATTWGFVGAKIYYLLEQLPNFDLHHLGGMGFTWYGGLIGGVVAALVVVHRHKLPLGVVPTNVPVHPTALYEALAAFGIAAVLWALGKHWNPAAVFGAYLTLSGMSRFLVEFLRINEPALLGLTQPQLWALASLAVGVVLIVRTQYRKAAAQATTAEEAVTAGSPI